MFKNKKIASNIAEIVQWEKIYTKAIRELWDYEEQIGGVNLRYWLMSQVLQESRGNANAKSPMGAMGFAQFMPKTAKFVGKKLKILYKGKSKMFKNGFDPYNIEQSIYAQVWYMNYLFSNWKAERPLIDKLMLSFASYNAGLGNILNAQKQMGGARHWVEIKKGLKRVTGRANSRETRGYVRNIIDMGFLLDNTV